MLFEFIHFGDSIYRKAKICYSVRRHLSRGYLHRLALENSGRAQIGRLAVLHRSCGKTNFSQRQFRALGLGSCSELATGGARLCLRCLSGKLGKDSQPQLAEGILVGQHCAVCPLLLVPKRQI